MLNNLSHHLKIWIWILPLLAIGFLFNTDFSFDVKSIDLEFSLFAFALTVSIFLFFSGLAYALLRKRKLNDYMSNMHMKLLAIGLGAFILPFIPLAILFGSESKIEANAGLIESGLDSGLVLVMILGVFILFMATLTYTINLIVTLLFNRHFEESKEDERIN